MGSVQRTKREYAPKHFSLHIATFSKLAKACSGDDEMYESTVFSADGYSWRLHLYPNGNMKANGRDYISLYLAVADFPSNQDVLAKFELFVFDQNENQYLTIYDGRVKRFHKMKREWGYDQLLELDVFKDPSFGYLVNDSCEFGVELLVVSSTTEKRQSIRMVTPSPTFRRTFKDLSQRDEDWYYARTPINFGEKKWRLIVYPKGDGNDKGNSLALFLKLVDAAKLPPGKQVWAQYKLRVVDQRQDKHVEQTFWHWFSCSNPVAWGTSYFMPLGDLHETRKDLLLKIL